MLYALWSLKHGVGTTVAAAALALHWAQNTEEGTLLVDLCGDLPYALGIPEPDKPGISDWLAAGDDLESDVLGRLEVNVATGLHMLTRGRRPYPEDAQFDSLARQLSADHRNVIIDCGCVWTHQMNWTKRNQSRRQQSGFEEVASSQAKSLGEGAAKSNGASGSYGANGSHAAFGTQSWHDPAQNPNAAAARFLIEAADHSLLVTQSCFLALRRIARSPYQPSGIVLMYEDGRALVASDIADLGSCPIILQIEMDLAIGRALDAGLLITRLPQRLDKALAKLKLPSETRAGRSLALVS